MATKEPRQTPIGAAWHSHGLEGVPKLTLQGAAVIDGLKHYLFNYELDGQSRQYAIPVEDFWSTQPALADHGRIRVVDMAPGDVVYPTGSLNPRLRVIEAVKDDGGPYGRKVMTYHRLGEQTAKSAVASAGTRWVLHRKAAR